MTIRNRRTGLVGRLVAAVALAVALVPGVAATPAQAYGSCGPATPGYLPLFRASLSLVRTSSCTYYARLVVDERLSPLWDIKVERRENGVVTERKTATGGYGSTFTGSVQGWWGGAASQDQHHACYSVAGANSWTCTSWVDV
ncbi:hypothetical protein O7635_26865 [Asanoa sp. WMMD1127]|uniref:hypothetical protein n=1 Tax=Asanoa sp. WMMD1127 TaxID=3016107 RepID=UPI002416B762|nr:hypothetical protein [Asanoa sp. WMMD1127]MDG4825485.1 hypothetical protein [Asanoa sp. WMMD1127]